MTPRRITLVSSQLLGYVRTGGVGTATTFLAIALARMGHAVEALYIGEPPTQPADPEWTRLYEQAGVTIRVLPRGEQVEPRLFARIHDVELALIADPPDVVITQDAGAPAYTALRLRQAGLALERTLFVVLCHGTRRWVKAVTQNVRVSTDVLGENVLERAALELADVVVSPSAYLVDWMREQGWRLPERTVVIAHFTRSGATGELPPGPARVNAAGRVERLAFFGRLEERKGLRPFAAGLNALGPELLERVELEFLGRTTKEWTPESVTELLSEPVRRALRGISFETDLDQHEVLARLGQPGTLAVIASLSENSPNTIYECLERGIPLIASAAGGIPELIAPDDRARVLFEPTPEGVRKAVARALSEGNALRPARAGFDDTSSRERWADVIALRPQHTHPTERPRVDVAVVRRSSNEALARCLAAMERQSYANFGVIVEASRAAALAAGEAPWIVFLDEEDVPEAALLETLVRAQLASGADVVTCGLWLEDDEGGRTRHLFLGEPGGLGLLSNGYGTVALLRRSLLGDVKARWPAADPDWPLLAGLTVAGARVMSVPLPLVTRTARPGALERHPSDALLVLERLEGALPDPLRSVARLAAGLAADSHARSSRRPAEENRSLVRAALRKLDSVWPLS